MNRHLCGMLVVSLSLPAATVAAQAGGSVALEEVVVAPVGVTIKVPKGWTDLTPSFAKDSQRDNEHPQTRIIASVSKRSGAPQGLDWAAAEAKKAFHRDAVEKAEVAPGRYQLVLSPVSGEQSVLVYEKNAAATCGCSARVPRTGSPRCARSALR